MSARVRDRGLSRHAPAPVIELQRGRNPADAHGV